MRMSCRPWNFSWIVPNQLAGSSCPSSIEEMRFLEKQGIHHLVTLSPDHAPPTNLGIETAHIPIEEFEAPSIEDINRFIGICDKAIKANQAVAVHCRAGRGRTGTMAACFFVYFLEMSPDSAISKTRMLRPGSVETYAQEKAVAQFRDYLRRQQE